MFPTKSNPSRATIPATPRAITQRAVRERAVRRGRIAIIDDEPAIGSSLVRLLRREYDAEAFTDAREVLGRILAGESYDFILCDMAMPGMTGLGFYSALERVAPEQASRLVLMSAVGWSGVVQNGLEPFRLPCRFMEKPFHPDDLRAAIAA